MSARARFLCAPNLRGCAPLALALLLVWGCAGPVYLGRYSYDKGWREAVVTDLSDQRGKFQHASKDCRADLDTVTISTRVFARVRFQYARNVYSVIALVPEGTSLHLGDTVYVNSSDCKDELMEGVEGGLALSNVCSLPMHRHIFGRAVRLCECRARDCKTCDAD